ncbi:hypothetical protein M422DRAFT_271488 [Sphaerobolus stellatus SS14]|uniref:RSE1/DDB1/CPSF1 first beta-propeller domain-containing protein n=1 Tax=Sphaerobolus stellatus (strain SS14) TaxID=990650 RepID=A0A0C9U008_SPHS4|nr:hypothetical protein M422DRAFT_271488 [Sphaerobolus stellatus SS14]
MHALRRELLPPSGVEFATSLKLTRAAVAAQDGGNRVIGHLVVARSSFLRIFEVREEPAPLPPVDDAAAAGRKGTEAVEGEIEMDDGGEGFVSVGLVKVTIPFLLKDTCIVDRAMDFFSYNALVWIVLIDRPKSATQNVIPTTVTRLYLLRSHRLHGTATGLDRVRTLATAEDGLDRLLVSFKDAKIALMEWSDAVFDLTTVSIHTYERAPQLLSFNSSSFRTQLRVDPESRCAALSLPRDGLAILPFYQTQADLDVGEQDHAFAKDVPYSPSFVLDLAEIDERIHNVVDLAFLPGFNNPTLGLLFETKQTWTGRLNEFKDTISLFIVTLDLNTRTYPIIMQAHSLPYDCFSILPCPISFGGVFVLSANAVIHVDQIGRTVAVPTNGWAPRVTEMKLTEDSETPTRNIPLEASRMTFVDDRNVFIFTPDGSVYPVEIVVEGRIVANIVIAPALARSTIPTVVTDVGSDHIFVGSTVGPSMLFKAVRVAVKKEDGVASDAVSQPKEDADMDLDDDIYGEKVDAPENNADGTTNTHVETHTIARLAPRDSLREYGPINDMVFGLYNDGDRYTPELVTCTGTEHLGGFTLFQRDLPTRMKREVRAIGGSRGVWSLSIRPGSKSSDLGPGSGSSADHDSIIVSTDASPAPGLSRMASTSAKKDMVIFGRATVTTVGAASFFQRTAILQVTTNALRVLEAGE